MQTVYHHSFEETQESKTKNAAENWNAFVQNPRIECNAQPTINEKITELVKTQTHIAENAKNIIYTIRKGIHKTKVHKQKKYASKH
jgi:ribosome recycling factor